MFDVCKNRGYANGSAVGGFGQQQIGRQYKHTHTLTLTHRLKRCRSQRGSPPCPRSARSLGLVVVAEVRAHPLLDLLDRHALALGVVGHGEAVGELDARGLLGEVLRAKKCTSKRGALARKRAKLSLNARRRRHRHRRRRPARRRRRLYTLLYKAVVSTHSLVSKPHATHTRDAV